VPSVFTVLGYRREPAIAAGIPWRLVEFRVSAETLRGATTWFSTWPSYHREDNAPCLGASRLVCSTWRCQSASSAHSSQTSRAAWAAHLSETRVSAVSLSMRLPPPGVACTPSSLGPKVWGANDCSLSGIPDRRQCCACHLYVRSGHDSSGGRFGQAAGLLRQGRGGAARTAAPFRVFLGVVGGEAARVASEEARWTLPSFTGWARWRTGAAR
jgi:hypothetical protein